MTLPLACVFIAYALIYLPKVPLSIAMARHPKGYDNRHPRDQQADLTGWGRRAAAAHYNAFESFAPFAAAVLVAHVTSANAKWSAVFAVTYVVARTAYPFIYIADIHLLRSTVWFIGVLATIGLFVLACVA